MSILGALLAFLVVMLTGIPLVVLMATSIAASSSVVVLLADAARYLLAGFVTVYVFGVVSSFVFVGLGEAVTYGAPTFRVRWVLLWILSLVYLVGTVLFFVLAAPPMFLFLLQASTPVAVPALAGGLALLWLVLLIPAHFIAVLLGYIAASVVAPRHDQYVYDDCEMFVRGLLIGLNAGMNLLLGTAAIGALVVSVFGIGGAWAGAAAGVVLAVVTLLTAAMPTGSQGANDAIKRIVGWMSWLMPTNWVAIFLGWLLYQVTALLSVLLGWTPFYGLYLINAALIEWPYGTMFIEGGVGSNLWLQGVMDSRGAYNLGSFSFVHADTVREPGPVPGLGGVGLGADLIFNRNLRRHEAGHNLNLTAFGAHFHMIGAVDENVPPVRRLRNAYAERLAESNVPGTARPALPFWTF